VVSRPLKLPPRVVYVVLPAAICVLLGVGLRLASNSVPELVVATRPTPEPAMLGRWEGLGTTQLPEFFAPGGTYEIAWNLSGLQAQPKDQAWQLKVSLFDYDFPHSQLGVAPKDVLDAVDFSQQPGRQPPFTDTVRLSPIPPGRYYLEVDTCQFCAWQLVLWQRETL
jgi:hypothetical protein